MSLDKKLLKEKNATTGINIPILGKRQKKKKKSAEIKRENV
jgi:hypothetical protein